MWRAPPEPFLSNESEDNRKMCSVLLFMDRFGFKLEEFDGARTQLL